MGRSKAGRERILGPYRDDWGWFYYYVGAEGERTRRRVRPGSSEAEARSEVDDARAALASPGEGLDVNQAVDLYVEQVERQGCDAQSTAWARHAAAPLMERYGRLPIDRLTWRHVEQYITDLSETPAAEPKTGPRWKLATQRSYWLGLRRMTAWWTKRGLTARDLTDEAVRRRAVTDTPLPWATKAARKALGRGKPQLRNMEEAVAYYDAACKLKTPEGRVGALLPLLTGISSGELRHLQAGDVSLSTRKLHVRGDDDEPDGWDVKSASRRRTLTIPEELAADVSAIVEGLEPNAYLFRQSGKRAGTPRDKTWLLKLVKRTCEAAETRVVPPHGLRATHSSLSAVVAEESAEAIAKRLGHADHGVTARRHYIGAEETVAPLRLVRGEEKGT